MASKLMLLGVQEEHIMPGVVIVAGYYTLLDKDQRVYLRTTDRIKAEDQKASLNARYPHMGFVVEWHKE